MITAHVVASSQISGTGRVALIVLGAVLVAGGLFMVIRPRRAATPPKWQYGSNVTPSRATVDLTRIGGVVWALAGAAMIVLVASA